ncbi:hypothetical protein WDZ92_42620 [Nostoc sp. NIES-2111]
MVGQSKKTKATVGALPPGAAISRPPPRTISTPSCVGPKVTFLPPRMSRMEQRAKCCSQAARVGKRGEVSPSSARVLANAFAHCCCDSRPDNWQVYGVPYLPVCAMAEPLDARMSPSASAAMVAAAGWAGTARLRVIDRSPCR